MNKQTIVKSTECFDTLKEIKANALNSIIQLMKSLNVNSLNFYIDQNGNSWDSEDYDEDWVLDHRVWVHCYDRYGHELAFVSEVSIVGDNQITITAEGEECTYDDEYVSHEVETYVNILSRIERILDNQ